VGTDYHDFRKAVTLYVGRTGVDLCQVAAMLSYRVPGAEGMSAGTIISIPESETIDKTSLCRGG